MSHGDLSVVLLRPFHTETIREFRADTEYRKYSTGTKHEPLLTKNTPKSTEPK